MLMMVMMMMMMMKIRIRNHMLSVESFKDYINFTRVAAYPDVAKFEESRERIEQSWPAYAKDFSLSRPSFLFGAAVCALFTRCCAVFTRHDVGRARVDTQIPGAVAACNGTYEPPYTSIGEPINRRAQTAAIVHS